MEIQSQDLSETLRWCLIFALAVWVFVVFSLAFKAGKWDE